jgi:tetratricopeptide (TPR) repeat protein
LRADKPVSRIYYTPFLVSGAVVGYKQFMTSWLPRLGAGQRFLFCLALTGTLLPNVASLHAATAPAPSRRSRSATATNVTVARPPLALTNLIARASKGEIEAARELFIRGNYDQCIKISQKALADREAEEDWPILLAQSYLAVGRYTNAYSVVTTNLDRFRNSVRLRLLGHGVALQNNQPEVAQQRLSEINNLGGYRMYAYQDVANLVALGKAALLLGADPKRVLEQFYDRAKKRDPTNREPYLASGQLALSKEDYDLAARTFGDGLKKFPKDPDLLYGLARAFAPSDRRRMLDAIEAALEANTNHVASYLLLADHLIDGEEYKAASKVLDQALAVNPWEPEAWAYRAVLAHLRNDEEAESSGRKTALKFWKTNPAVDHVIGRKLSQKYRFTEGAAYQRQAVKFDPKHLSARIQLSQDLLRLGEEEEGWRLAKQVHEADAYDVTAFNLVTLQESMDKFATLTNRDFVVRMATNEAVIYGDKVLALLDRAKSNLSAKYELELTNTTIVEIFPRQKDFGVRTFGMPDNPGYLGVCFGSVITANSPASQASHAANWQAVLWHEFCHVITLQLTRNKMPRWLSEGISVYEELQENPTWGQSMDPKYRTMILGDDFVPLAELSAAFLAPKSEVHLQFAYYESSLAVEFLVQKFGLDAVKKILRELSEGMEINPAISKHTAPLDELEADFAKFARERAEKLAPDLEFEKPKTELLGQLLDELPLSLSRNYYALMRQARQLAKEKKWKEAKEPLEKLLKAYPNQTGADNAYSLLATAHRALSETNDERKVLTQLAAIDADAIEAYARLMELDSLAPDWSLVETNAQRYLAVNPLVPLPYRYLAQASEALGRTNEAIRASRTLLMLDPPDPAGAYFQLARLLHRTGDPTAKRYLLQALEEAPRFREGHRLLLEMTASNHGSRTNQPKASAPQPSEGPAKLRQNEPERQN